MSGLPDIGSLRAQVGYSRLELARLEPWGRPILRDGACAPPHQDEGGGIIEQIALPYSAACGRASWIARQTRSGVAGISIWRTP
jgi:hypothetical protein